MKKSFSVIVAVLIFLGVFVPVAYSQEQTAFEKAYETYKLTIEDYQIKHDDYVLARAQYLRFQTQQSRDDAHAATTQMLKARDDVVMTYLAALKERLLEAEGLDENVVGDLLVEIDSEASWFEDHKNTLDSALTLDDLVGDSNQAKSRFGRVESLAYKEVSNISHGKVIVLRERLNGTFSDLTEKFGEIKEEDREDYKFSADKLQSTERWISESELSLQRADERENSVLDSIALAKTHNLSSYNKILGVLEEEKLLFVQVIGYLQEVVRQIKVSN